MTRTIETTAQFRKDFKREQRIAQSRRFNLDRALSKIVDLLVEDRPLPAKFRDHPLTGDWNDYRDCHVRPDLVLIYRKAGRDRLQLVRIGSHSELSL
jgi:mRNA interferase YafQ